MCTHLYGRYVDNLSGPRPIAAGAAVCDVQIRLVAEVVGQTHLPGRTAHFAVRTRSPIIGSEVPIWPVARICNNKRR